jgi:hypothetical protein
MVAVETCRHCDKSRRLSPDEVRTIRGRLSLTMHKAPLSAGAGKPAAKKTTRRATRPQTAARRAERKQVRQAKPATARIPRDPVSHRRIVRPVQPEA